ncbi:MAG: SpoIIIAH-like family protein [Ruminococcus sp.]|nr:SpoIIIAH-like family protein [Ruminococcus sp.]
MKKIFKKNQIIITALAVMIAAAGYISYSDFKSESADTTTKVENGEDVTASLDDVLQDIESLDEDISDEEMASAETTGDDTAETTTETPGEAVLTGASTYMAEARITREQIRSQNKETLLEIINNSDLTEDERESAVASMVNMTDTIEKEAAAELLLEAKGFENVVVNLTGETADIVVPSAYVDDASRAQIEDIVKRKTGIEAENIVITPMSEE